MRILVAWRRGEFLYSEGRGKIPVTYGSRVVSFERRDSGSGCYRRPLSWDII